MTAFEPPRTIGTQVSQAAKQRIGRHAAGLLRDDQSVLFDSSSTVLEAARAAVARRLRLTAATNDLEIAQTLAAASQNEVIVLGGTVRKGSLTMIGEPGASFAQRLHADVALIGIHSLAGGRLSETSIEVSTIKRCLIGSAGKVIVLADLSKFDFPAFYEVCGMDLVDAIVVEEAPPAEVLAGAGEAGVTVLVADEAAGAPTTAANTRSASVGH